VKLNQMVCAMTTVQHLAAEILYYPYDQAFPLVDICTTKMNLESWLEFKLPCQSIMLRQCQPVKDYMTKLGLIQKTPHWSCTTCL